MKSKFSVFELSFQVALVAGSFVGNDPVVVVLVGHGLFQGLAIAALVIAGQVDTRLDFSRTHGAVHFRRPLHIHNRKINIRIGSKKDVGRVYFLVDHSCWRIPRGRRSVLDLNASDGHGGAQEADGGDQDQRHEDIEAPFEQRRRGARLHFTQRCGPLVAHQRHVLRHLLPSKSTKSALSFFRQMNATYG